jgi:hypothetical protein
VFIEEPLNGPSRKTFKSKVICAFSCNANKAISDRVKIVPLFIVRKFYIFLIGQHHYCCNIFIIIVAIKLTKN